MKNKKLYIALGTTAAIGAVVTAIVVPASLRSHDEKYEVSIAKANGAHYTILRLDPATNKGAIPKLNIWDIEKNDQEAINKVAEKLGMSEVTQLMPTINAGKGYTNGLEKFIYDLLNLKNNGETLTIVSPVKFAKDGASQNYKIAFNQSFIAPSGNTETQVKIRSDMLVAMLTSTDDNSRSFQEGLTNILLYDQSTKNVRTTTIDDIRQAILKFTK